MMGLVKDHMETTLESPNYKSSIISMLNKLLIKKIWLTFIHYDWFLKTIDTHLLS